MKRLSLAFAGMLAVVLTVFGCATPQGPAWITLIDGPKGLENFDRIGSSNWAVVDGIVQADKKSGKETGYLVTKTAYKDFQIRVEFWASDDANSGIFMRCQNPEVITDKSCYEANIFDRRPDPTYGTGGIVHHAKVSPMPKAGGKWNLYEITTQGQRIVVTLNGVKTVEFNAAVFDSGPIALQHGAGVIKFRKVQIKPL